VNQVEFHPFLYQRELSSIASSIGSNGGVQPLARGRRLKHPVIVEIAARYGRTPAQILIRWSLSTWSRRDPEVRSPGAHSRECGRVRFRDQSPDMARLDALTNVPTWPGIRTNQPLSSVDSPDREGAFYPSTRFRPWYGRNTNFREVFDRPRPERRPFLREKMDDRAAAT